MWPVSFLTYQAKIEHIGSDFELVDSIPNSLLELLLELLLHWVVELLAAHHELV